MTYPGAEHTRFAHSLGVFNFAQRIINLLLLRYRKSSEITDLIEASQKNIKAAALLHDIGHGPFSHLIERAFPAVADHEKKTISLIKNSPHILQALSKADLNPEDVADLILKKTSCRLLADIISSQLDADRMDYILRDALNTGVKYGAFDSEWVLNSLCIGQEPNAKNGNLSTLRLCLDEQRGLYSAEQIVMARMHMSFQVYFHRVTRGWEAHLLCLLNLAAQYAQHGILPKKTSILLENFLLKKGTMTDEEWLFFDESCIEASLHNWAMCANDELRELSRTFLLREKLFGCFELGEVSLQKSIQLFHEASKIGKQDIHWLLDDPTFTSYKDFDASFRSSKGGSEDLGAISTSAILVASGDINSYARPAEALSLVLSALGQNPSARQPIRRLYYHRSLKEKFQKILDELDIKCV